jgi:hypothetical protein
VLSGVEVLQVVQVAVQQLLSLAGAAGAVWRGGAVQQLVKVLPGVSKCCRCYCPSVVQAWSVLGEAVQVAVHTVQQVGIWCRPSLDVSLCWPNG